MSANSWRGGSEKFDIGMHRLHAQQLAEPRFDEASEVVRWLGAVQAQDYLGALWAIGLRLRSSREALVEQAIANKSIVRSWPMRGTLHFVPAEDLRWLLALLAPRVLARTAARLEREAALTKTVFVRSAEVLIRALQGGKQLSRDALYRELEAAGIGTAAQRGLRILWWLAQCGLICLATRQGKQQTYALLDEWLPGRAILEGDAALAQLARRYFTSRGPATLQDFMWWSGLSRTEAQTGLELVKADFECCSIDGQTYWFSSCSVPPGKRTTHAHLLPAYDEYTIAYKNRSAVLDPDYAQRADAGSGIFHPTIVMNGRIVGTWKRDLAKHSVALRLNTFANLDKSEMRAIDKTAKRYGEFLGQPVMMN